MKKVLSVILAIMMIATAMPMVFAAEECEHVFDEETLVRPYFEKNTLHLGNFTCSICNETVVVHLAKEKITEYAEVYAYTWYIGEVASYHTDEVMISAKEKVSNLMNNFYAKYEGINPYYLTEYEEHILSSMINDLKVIATDLEPFEEDIIYNMESAVIAEHKINVLDEYYAGYIPSEFVVREEKMNELQEELENWSNRIYELSELIIKYAQEHPESPYNPEYTAEVEEYYAFHARNFNISMDCAFNNKHLVEKFSDCGDGTHKGDCSFCVAEGVTEAHTWGEYTENTDGTKTAKCISCEATDTIIPEIPDDDENVDIPENPDNNDENNEAEIPFDELNFYEKLIELIKNFLELLKEFFESVFA